MKRNTRPAEKKVTSANHLQLESIVNDNTMSDDQKITMYSMKLSTYLSAPNSLEMPWFAPVLGKHFKLDETAVITHSSNADEKEAERMSANRIIKNVPKPYQARAKKMYRTLERLHRCQLEH